MHVRFYQGIYVHVNAGPWLKPAFDRVLQSARMDQLPHAILVHGAPGWGETNLATSIAEYFIGLAPGELGIKSAENFAHPDFHWLQPEAPGKQIKVDQIRRLRSFVLQTCQIAERKVAVIVDAHLMNINAANALLKTLEEPPGECLLVLSTNAHHDLLPTIRSRCQSLPIRPHYDSANIAWVKTQLDSVLTGAESIATDELNILLFEFGGAPMFVLQAIQRGEKGLLPDLLVCVGRSDQIARILPAWLKLDLDIVLSRWMRYLNVLLEARSRSLVDSGDIGNNLQALENALNKASKAKLLIFWEELCWAKRLMHSTSNINQTLLLERLLLHWCELAHS